MAHAKDRIQMPVQEATTRSEAQRAALAEVALIE